MHHDSAKRLASVIVIATGTLWGLYWLPVRRLSELGLTGAWGSLAIVAAAALLLAPVALVRRRAFAGTDRLAVASVLLGGAAFALYSVALVYGRVAIIILLFFLTPVWSTLIARYALRWPTPRLRVLALACGLLGLGVMLGADGTLPRPRSAGEWLALVSGMLWAVASTGIRLRAPVAPPEAAFVFATGACLGAASVAPFLAPWPSALPAGHLGPAVGWVLLAGGLWWGLSMAGLMWATARLDPARVGILLMAEVLVGAASAALIAGERLGPLELAGGALVLAAGVLEVWPVRRR